MQISAIKMSIIILGITRISYASQVSASRCCQQSAEPSAVPVFQTSTQTTSTATGASLKRPGTGSSSSFPSWTWKIVTACRASATTTRSRSMTGTARRTPCWAAGAAEKGLPRSYRGATGCWWFSAQTETEPTEDSPRLISVVNALCLQPSDFAEAATYLSPGTALS